MRKSSVFNSRSGSWVYDIYDSSPLGISTLFHTIHLEPNHNHNFTRSPIHCQKLVSFKKFILLHWFNVTQPCIFYFILFNFTILYWFCRISKWMCHRYTCVPHPEPSSLLPPHTIPLGRPSAPAPSIQYRASNLDWQLISYMIFYMFQCHSPKSSHPLPLSQSP